MASGPTQGSSGSRRRLDQPATVVPDPPARSGTESVQEDT
jgi:hypothetical protein